MAEVSVEMFSPRRPWPTAIVPPSPRTSLLQPGDADLYPLMAEITIPGIRQLSTQLAQSPAGSGKAQAQSAIPANKQLSTQRD